MSSRVSIELDSQAQAAYVQLSGSEVATTRQLTDAVLVDLHELGGVVGIEVLTLDPEIPFGRLESECHVHSSVIDALRLLRPSAATAVAMPQPA